MSLTILLVSNLRHLSMSTPSLPHTGRYHKFIRVRVKKFPTLPRTGGGGGDATRILYYVHYSRSGDVIHPLLRILGLGKRLDGVDVDSCINTTITTLSKNNERIIYDCVIYKLRSFICLS